MPGAFLRARRAIKRGLITTEAYRFQVVSLVFFFATLLTNSNNRLAIGETFMMTAAAFGFYCFYLIQEQDRESLKTRTSPSDFTQESAMPKSVSATCGDRSVLGGRLGFRSLCSGLG